MNTRSALHARAAVGGDPQLELGRDPSWVELPILESSTMEAAWEDEADRDALDGALALYAAALPATRTGPLFNAFSYPTKISPETIALFIATHTEPGDTVLDVFSGSGTTGLAAKLCANPTPLMQELVERLNLSPTWGPRHAVLYDIGVMAAFLSRVMCNPPDPSRFRAAAEKLVSLAEASHGWLYETTDPDGGPGTIRHTIWSDVLACPHCDAETTYWEAAVRFEPLRHVERFDCRGCGSEVAISDCDRPVEEIADPLLGLTAIRKRRVPVRVYGRSGSRNWQRPASDADVEPVERATTAPVPKSAPRVEMDWGDLYRAGYHRGITHLHHFYTPRNFLAVAVLWDLIDQFDADLRDPLRLLVLSFNASHSTLMTRVVVKQNQSDLVLTGAQSGVLYISGLPVEKNVFLGVRRKISTFVRAFEMVYDSESTVDVVNASSTDLALADKSIDYVFTDPPFGDYIPYAEINELNEAWLGATTDREAEIIVSQSGGKGVSDYAELMADVFAEVSRVLRPTGLATVVFHSAKADVWQALTDAYTKAGLAVRTTSVLDKVQASFKQVVSTTSVKGDPLILLSSQAVSGLGQLRTVDDVVSAVLADARVNENDDERTKERLFSRFITRCLVEGIPVTVGAAEFYRRAALATEQ